jgi:rhomboid family protein
MKRIAQVLIVANIVVFALEAMYGDAFIDRFALWPLGRGFAWWQIVTSAFLHADPTHLLVNMLGLWMFGRDVERALGSMRFVQLYFLSILTAAIAQLIVTALMQQNAPTLGASGALFGVLGAFAMLYPNRVIMLLIPPIPLPARIFVFLYALVELASGVFGTQAGVAHFAHLGGLAGGLWLLSRWRKQVY